MKKRIALVITVVLLLAVGAYSTIAYLQDLTAPVVNTFTVGNVHLTLSEPSWNPLEDHKLVPSASFAKEPTVVVKANGEDCYVATKITIPTMLDPLVSLNINTANWILVKTVGEDYYYKYFGLVTASESDKTLEPLFTQVTVLGSVTNEQLAALGITDKQLSVQAFAIQAEGFATEIEALNEWIPE